MFAVRARGGRSARAIAAGLLSGSVVAACSWTSQEVLPAADLDPPPEAMLESSGEVSRVDPVFREALERFERSVRVVELAADHRPAVQRAFLELGRAIRTVPALAQAAAADEGSRRLVGLAMPRPGNEHGALVLGFRTAAEFEARTASQALESLAEGPYRDAPEVRSAARRLTRLVRTMSPSDARWPSDRRITEALVGAEQVLAAIRHRLASTE
jgi:hypothetical protein